MKKTFIVANWKSNKTILQAEEWFRTLNDLQLTLNKEEKEVIVCPPFTLLPSLKSLIAENKLPISLGAQDISPFNEGAFTGAINGRQIKEFADYVLVGHSERRRYFAETQAFLAEKVKMANKWNLKVIFCADSEKSLIPDGVSIVTYEPPTSISPAPADTPENAERAARALKAKTLRTVLYGGNVTSGNVSSFMQMKSINGVLVGRASLDAQEFYEIIQSA